MAPGCIPPSDRIQLFREIKPFTCQQFRESVTYPFALRTSAAFGACLVTAASEEHPTMASKKRSALEPNMIKKARTGIDGFDAITYGGLPAGRPTLICGGPGAGKTMLAAEILVCGATECKEPGVFMMFEETAEELTENVRSLG